MIRLLLLGALCIAMPAFAADPRTIDMTTVIVDLRGKPIIDGGQATPEDPRCEKCEPLTLGVVVSTALLSERKDEPNLSSIEKGRRGLLAMRVADDKAAVLTSAQISEIIRLLNVWAPLVVARVIPMLDPAVDIGR